jgi:hypothetical protein
MASCEAFRRPLATLLGIRSTSKTGPTHHMACGWPCQRPHSTLKPLEWSFSRAFTLPHGVHGSSESGRPARGPGSRAAHRADNQRVESRSRTCRLHRHALGGSSGLRLPWHWKRGRRFGVRQGVRRDLRPRVCARPHLRAGSGRPSPSREKIGPNVESVARSWPMISRSYASSAVD